MLELIRSISGPEFLLVYLVYCIAVMVVFKLFNTRLNMETGNHSNDEIDIYSISVLRANNRPEEIAKTMLFKLWTDGYLRLKEESRKVLFEMVKSDGMNLLPIEKDFLNLFSASASFGEVVLKRNNLNKLRAFGNQLKTNLIKMQLMKDSNRIGQEKRLRIVFYIVMLILGLIKLSMGIKYEKPIGFLIMEIILMTVVFFVVNRVSAITADGQRYLDGKSDEYSWVKDSKINKGSSISGDNAAMAVALFGMASIYGVPEFGMVARAAQPPSSSSSGYSCSSSSCSSSGCSGSSCGGGGCGGCGGS